MPRGLWDRMRVLVAALSALALVADAPEARAFVPPATDHACPRAALHGAWIAYAHALDGVELTAADHLRSKPGRLELTLAYSSGSKKTNRSVLFEIEKLPSACVARSVYYSFFDVTCELELTSRDELTIRATDREGAHVIRLRRAS